MDDYYERMNNFVPYLTISSCMFAISLGLIVYNSAQTNAELLNIYREMKRELKIVSESQKAIEENLDRIEVRMDGT